MDHFIRKQLYTSVARKIATTIIKTSSGNTDKKLFRTYNVIVIIFFVGMDTSKISLLNYLVFCSGTQGFTNQYMMTDGGSREYWIEVLHIKIYFKR